MGLVADEIWNYELGKAGLHVSSPGGSLGAAARQNSYSPPVTYNVPAREDSSLSAAVAAPACGISELEMRSREGRAGYTHRSRPAIHVLLDALVDGIKILFCVAVLAIDAYFAVMLLF